MRMLYARMRYTVTSHGTNREFTETFRSWWGILAGDSFSPNLFTFFKADCVPPGSPYDIELDGVAVMCLFLADDIVFIEELNDDMMEGKLGYMDGEWCPDNFLKMNVKKTKAMILGRLPQELPNLKVNSKRIEIVETFKYVGVHFQSTHHFIFAEHYKQKAKEALKSMFPSVAWVESMIGDLWPVAMLCVFMARVDPHLVHGCEVAVDIHPPSFKLLDDVHVFGLRRILQVGSHSVKVALYTETGVLPLNYRHAKLQLCCVQYLIALPREQLAAAGYRDAVQLLQNGKPGWFGDIKYMLNHLPLPVKMHLKDIETLEGVNASIGHVDDSCAKWLHEELETNERTPLLKGRLKTNQVPVLKDVVRLRPYL
ncbi:hypothetical protein CPB84DRAFT_749360 [Gymnopilus junonius]|uniref:Reverse transcriptase n=1 Tax=Gymnopilus junonius TaxID=109634 RepID=A0A9P5TT88_GYMJU|nr:hypothetical protein CPB84DRAFT_749360 [Gymnopilus junonius]